MPSSLAKALMSAQAELKAIKKGSTNPHFKSKYADLEDCIAATRPVLAKHGLVVSQATKFIPEGAVVLLETTLTHCDSGESKTSEWPLLPGKANDPQALGSALTYARRYGHITIIGAVTSDDDDDGERAAQRHEAPQTTAQPPASDPLKTVRQEVHNAAAELEQRVGQSIGAHVKAASTFTKDGKTRGFSDPFDPSITSEKWLKTTLSRLLKELEKTEPGAADGAEAFVANDDDVAWMK